MDPLSKLNNFTGASETFNFVLKNLLF
jgi:hypothetical protein